MTDLNQCDQYSKRVRFEKFIDKITNCTNKKPKYHSHFQKERNSMDSEYKVTRLKTSIIYKPNENIARYLMKGGSSSLSTSIIANKCNMETLDDNRKSKNVNQNFTQKLCSSAEMSTEALTIQDSSKFLQNASPHQIFSLCQSPKKIKK